MPCFYVFGARIAMKTLVIVSSCHWFMQKTSRNIKIIPTFEKKVVSSALGLESVCVHLKARTSDGAHGNI